MALDAKMSFDDNAMFRRPQIAEIRDTRRKIPARPMQGSWGSTMSVSWARSAASSMAPASPWRPWT